MSFFLLKIRTRRKAAACAFRCSWYAVRGCYHVSQHGSNRRTLTTWTDRRSRTGRSKRTAAEAVTRRSKAEAVTRRSKQNVAPSVHVEPWKRRRRQSRKAEANAPKLHGLKHTKNTKHHAKHAKQPPRETRATIGRSFQYVKKNAASWLCTMIKPPPRRTGLNAHATQSKPKIARTPRRRAE